MSHSIVPEKRLAALIAAIDSMALAEEAFQNGKISYAKYSAATDRVIRERG